MRRNSIISPRQVLEVRRCMVGTPAFSVVETGDIILAVDGKTVTRFRVSSEKQHAYYGTNLQAPTFPFLFYPTAFSLPWSPHEIRRNGRLGPYDE